MALDLIVEVIQIFYIIGVICFWLEVLCYVLYKLISYKKDNTRFNNKSNGNLLY